MPRRFSPEAASSWRRSNRSDALTALTRAASLNPLPEYQWILADTLRSSDRAGRRRGRRARAHRARHGQRPTHGRALPRDSRRGRIDRAVARRGRARGARRRLHARRPRVGAGGERAHRRGSDRHRARARRRHGGRAGCSCTPASFMPPRATSARPRGGCTRRTACARCSCRRKTPCSPDSSPTNTRTRRTT